MNCLIFQERGDEERPGEGGRGHLLKSPQRLCISPGASAAAAAAARIRFKCCGGRYGCSAFPSLFGAKEVMAHSRLSFQQFAVNAAELWDCVV